MAQPTRWGAFRDLDAAEDSQGVIEWLGRVADLAPIRDGKRRSYELLGAKPDARVLDVGCGRGDDVLALSRLAVPRRQVTGVDSSAEAVQAARQAALKDGVDAQFQVGDALALPFSDAAFDACRCDRTLQHIADPQAALREMVRVLRPGGVLLIAEGRHQVLADPDVDLTRLNQLLGLFQTEAERSGWIGFMLPLLLAQVGLEEMQIESVAGELTEAETIATWYDLPRLARRAVAEGQLDRAQLAAVDALIEREAAAGRLRVAIETLLFVGRSPHVRAQTS